MDTQQVLAQLDKIYASGDFTRVSTWLDETMAAAKEEGDLSTQITLGNEKMGLLRELGRTKEAIGLFVELAAALEELGLTETEGYAGTLQNGANAYRVDGNHEEAIRLFETALGIYAKLLDPSDSRFAGLYNNLALVYQDEGDLERAADYGEKALAIIEKIPDSLLEQATSHVNLAELQSMRGDFAAAREHLERADALFAQEDYSDPHLAALYSARGQIAFLEKDYETALAEFEKARAELMKYYGRSTAYATVTQNMAAALSRLGRTGEAEQRRAEAAAILEDLKNQ